MAKDYSPQISAILIALNNINDKLRKIEDKIIEKKTNEPQVFKHIVAIKQGTKPKEKDGGKISR